MARTAVHGFGLVAALMLGCLHAPVLWSPDGRWVAYTVAVRPSAPELPPGWLYRTAPAHRQGWGSPGRGRRGVADVYRVWATRPDSGESILLEESRGPLTSPAWSPDGKALAFGRLIPEDDGRARFEIVLQEAPERQRILSSRPHREIHAKAADLPGLALAWSPDGRYLAVPFFQQNLGLAILRAENGRVLKVVEDAYLPSWSPDSSKLAFVRGGDAESLQLLDNSFGVPRQLAEIGQTGQVPTWSRDNETLLVIARRSGPRAARAPSQQVELLRVGVDSGQVERIAHMTTEPIGRDDLFHGASFSLDHSGDDLFYTSDVEGQPTVITWFRPRTRETYKRFHPIDTAFQVGALAVSPDGKRLAMRVGGPGYLAPPAVYDLATERLTPLIPDDSARVEWISTFVTAARDLLETVLPAAMVDGVPVERPTLLPIPGEFGSAPQVGARLRRLGRLARPLCERPAGAAPAPPELQALLDEARLFFDYLREDYHAALDSLERLEARTSSPEERLRLLSLRAQIFLGQGATDRAAETIAFLETVQRVSPARLESTPAGPVLTREDDPHRRWPSYLSARSEAWIKAGLEADRVPQATMGLRNLDAPLPGLGLDPADIPVLIAPAPLEELAPAPERDEVIQEMPRLQRPVPPLLRRARRPPPG
jgi:Tol biopolymer transport system component